MIMKVMPFFLPVFSFGFPAGLALYWCTQNMCRIGTNSYITHSVYKKEHAKAPIETTARDKPQKSDRESRTRRASTRQSEVVRVAIQEEGRVAPFPLQRTSAGRPTGRRTPETRRRSQRERRRRIAVRARA